MNPIGATGACSKYDRSRTPKERPRLGLLVGFCLYLLLVGCDSSEPLREGVLQDNRYSSSKLGWSMPLPLGWRPLPSQEVEEIARRGAAIFEATGEPEAGLTELLWLRNGPRTIFASNRHRYESSVYGSPAEVHAVLIRDIETGYRLAGIPIRSDSGEENFDGIAFHRTTFHLLSRGGAVEVAKSCVFSGLIGDQILTVSVTSAYERDLEIGLASWRSSAFIQRMALSENGLENRR